MRKLVYYVAVSLDGRIASPDGDFSAFPVEGDHFDVIFRDFADALPAPAIAALGLRADGSRFDTVLMGFNTYAVGLPELPSPTPDITRVASDPRAFVRELKSETAGSDIWLCGGAQLASELVDEIDTLILKVNPVILGSGIPLLNSAYAPVDFELVSSQSFDSGVVINELSRR